MQLLEHEIRIEFDDSIFTKGNKNCFSICHLSQVRSDILYTLKANYSFFAVTFYDDVIYKCIIIFFASIYQSFFPNRNVLVCCWNMWCQFTNTIQNFVVFPGTAKYSEAYHHFINTKDSLELFFLKFLFLGPPRLGKTTVRRRLMGEIQDIKSAGEAEQPQPSTGTVETGHSVVVKTVSNTAAVVTESEWSAIASLEDEARMLFHNLVDTISSKSSTPLEATANEALPNHSIHRDDESSSSQSNTDSLLTTQVTDERRPNYSLSPTMFSQDMLDITTIFNEAMGSAYWKDVKHMFKAHLRMEDTGGQPELMDMLPALTIGPGLYLLFINLQNELDELYRLSYCNASGKSTPPVDSTYTVMEMLFSALSSICCSKSIPTNILDDEKLTPELKNNILESSHSVAYIVGTHKDKVTEERIKILDKQLKEKITSTAFYSQNILQFSSEDDLIVTVDNMEGGKEEICHVRALLEKAMERHFKKLKIPAVWLLFSLCLRKKNMRTAKLDFCIQMSRMLNMSEYETKVAIWFLHRHAGVMMYFPNVPELKDLVIIDIQIVYDSVTILILRAMNYEEVGHCNAEEFKNTGQFSLSHIIAATSKVTGDVIPPQKLVALLEFLHIIARFSERSRGHTVTSCYKQDDVTYIMPCVLQNASKDKLDDFCKDTPHSNSIAPLIVCYKCGFVPIGVFPAVIASLIANSSFRLIKKGIMKNLVQFRYGSLLTLVTFMCRPKFYEIIISELPIIQHEPHIECAKIKKEVESTFEKVSSHMNYGYFMDYQFAFECPSHPGREHLCVVDGQQSTPSLMLCLQDLTKKSPEKMSSCHTVWFGEVCHLSCLSSLFTVFISAEITMLIPVFHQ